MQLKDDISAIIIIVLVILIRFAPFLIFQNPINTDSWKSYYPWRASYNTEDIKTISYDPDIEYGVWYPMVKQELANGQFPHWNPYSFCGAPLYANHLVPIFHLPFALALIAPDKHILTVYSLLMALMGTLFFYAFLRNWRLSIYASLFGAMSYFLSGWLCYLYTPEVATMVWIPAILLFYDRFLNSGKFTDAALCAFSVGQILICGYPIYVTHFLYVFIVYVICRRFSLEFKDRFNTRRWLAGLVMICLGGTLLSAVQNIPTYEFMRLANRDIGSEKEKFETPEEIKERKEIELAEKGNELGIVSLIKDQIAKKSSVIVPFFQTHRTLSRNFAGPILILFGLIGLFIGNRKYNFMKILFVIFSIFFFVAPLYIPIAKIVPGWSVSIYIPHEVFSFLLFFIAAIGVDTLGQLRKPSRFVMLISVLMILITIGLITQHPLFNTTNEIFRWSIKVDLYFLILYMGIAIILILIVFTRAIGIDIKRPFLILAMFLFISSGLAAHYYIFQYFHAKDPMPINNDIQAIIDKCVDGRIARYDPSEPRFSFSEIIDYVLPANIPASYGVMDTSGYDSLIIGDYYKFLQMIDDSSIMWERAVPHYDNVKSFSKNGLLQFGASNRYILARGDLDENPELNEIAQKIYDGGVDIYEMKNHAPMYRLVDSYALRSKMESNVSLSPSILILEKKPKIEISSDSFVDEYIRVTDLKRTNSTIEIEIDTESNYLLYIAETYHPRWRATIDGNDTEILQANLAFRAIEIEAGQHTVKMWYDGIDVRNGAIISIAAFFIIILVSIADRKRFSTNR